MWMAFERRLYVLFLSSLLCGCSENAQEMIIFPLDVLAITRLNGRDNATKCTAAFVYPFP